MFINKTNSFSRANNGSAKREQKKKSDLKNHTVPGPKLHYEFADCGKYLKKISKNQSALKSNNVPGPRLHYNCTDFEEALGYSSKNQRFLGNPDIFGPQQDVCGCQGGGCPRCWKN
jgi:hypothetical protein